MIALVVVAAVLVVGIGVAGAVYLVDRRSSAATPLLRHALAAPRPDGAVLNQAVTLLDGSGAPEAQVFFDLPGDIAHECVPLLSVYRNAGYLLSSEATDPLEPLDDPAKFCAGPENEDGWVIAVYPPGSTISSGRAAPAYAITLYLGGPASRPATRPGFRSSVEVVTR
jgi:hypothetical protein